MKLRSAVLLFILPLIMLISGCKNSANSKIDNHDDSMNPIISELNNDDFSVSNGNQEVILGGKYSDLSTFDTLNYVRPSDGKIMNEIYVFENCKLEVSTSADNEKTIRVISLTTSEFQTKRGIMVGHKLEDIQRAYGDYDSSVYGEIRNSYLYFFEGAIIVFITDTNNTIVAITFEYV